MPAAFVQLDLFSSSSTAAAPSDSEARVQGTDLNLTFHVGHVDVAASPYVHLIRAKDDPERSPRGPGRALLWRNLDTHTPEQWAERITTHVSDGVPRTFNRIMVELSDFTADVAFGTNAEEGLWVAVANHQLALTHDAPILFTMAACGTIHP